MFKTFRLEKRHFVFVTVVAIGISIWVFAQLKKSANEKKTQTFGLHHWSRRPDSVRVATKQETNLKALMGNLPKSSPEYVLVSVRSKMLKDPVKGLNLAISKLREIARKRDRISPEDRSIAVNLIAELKKQSQSNSSVVARLALVEISASSKELSSIVESLRESAP